MAAAVGSAPSRKETQGDSLTCPMCLEIFTSPKILPCFHTFCEKCLESFAGSLPGTTFPCPSCREVIHIPTSGVTAFKANFYIKPEDLEKARKGLFCSVHPKRDLELFCVDCDVCICLMCKVTDHLTHKAEDIQKTMDKAMSKLSDDRTRLTNAVLTTQKRIDKISKEQEALKRKEEAVEQNIHNRHNAVVAAAATVREKALASLKAVSNDIHTNLSSAMEQIQQNLSKLCELKHQLEDCQKSGSVTQALKMVEEMKEGDGREAAVEKLTSEHVSAIIRPVLQHRDSAQEMVQGMQGYMGEAVQVEMDPCEPEVEVKEFIHCGKQQSDCQVVSLCPTDDSVWVSYKTSVLNSEARKPQKLNEEGAVTDTLTDVCGEALFKTNTLSGFFYEERKERTFVTYVKSSKLIQLTGDMSGNIKIERSRIISRKPIKTEEQTVFTIHCSKYRSCDIDDSEEFLVVVEEAAPPNTQRKILLFQRPKPFPLDTYTPPALPSHTQKPLIKPSLTSTDTSLTDHSHIEADKPVTNPSLATTGAALTDPSLATTDTALTDPSLATTGAALTDPSLATTGAALTDPSLATTGAALTDPSLATTGAALPDPSLATTGATLPDPSLATTGAALPDPSLATTDTPLTDPGPTTTDTALPKPSLLTTDKPLMDLNTVPELRFQPTDVCFCKLGGQEVVLVSDEARDAIHVLHVQEGKLRFLRYLAPGCPLLLQPSALNVDSKGRLWVACRGGSILVCTPLERSV